RPIEKYIRPMSSLTIVPDDALYYLPFEMLVTGLPSSYRPDYLLARYPISYAYSAGLLLELPKNSDALYRGPLLIANPDFGAARPIPSTTDLASRRWTGLNRPLAPLPFTEEEVARVRKLLGRPTTLIGAQATEAAFKREAARAGIIHIATHSM